MKGTKQLKSVFIPGVCFERDNHHNRANEFKEASLTVEAALVMPIFLYFIIALLYFMQIFTLQEHIQSEITEMGLNLSRTAYFYKDFPDLDEALNFDETVFGSELNIGLNEITDKIMSGYSLKLYANQYLDQDWINNSCIVGGFDGIDFSYSSLSNDDNVIDIILSYKIEIPVKVFLIHDMSILQRARLRAWTGYEVDAVYGTESESKDNDGTTVYVTQTGSVYHKSKECSHLKLSVRVVSGIPTELRNENGARYYRCEICCKDKLDENAAYYITSDGTRYHTQRNCSTLKRNIREILLSDVGSRTPCKRCYK